MPPTEGLPSPLTCPEVVTLKAASVHFKGIRPGDGDHQKAKAAARPRRPCPLIGRGHQEALAPSGPDAVWMRRKTRGCSKP